MQFSTFIYVFIYGVFIILLASFGCCTWAITFTCRIYVSTGCVGKVSLLGPTPAMSNG